MIRKYILPLFILFFIGGIADAQTSAKQFPSVKIGNQEWMTMNWDFKTPKSFFYNNDSTIDKIYGRLYYYSNAIGAAPPGWHLPTLDEWWELINYLGGPSKAAATMFAVNDSSIQLVAGGYKSANISEGEDLFGFKDKYAFYWTATPDGDQTAYAIHITKSNGEFEITSFRRAN
ncbi:MAG: FISUMP domain-containing protein, partial [Chitinophagales bacterium]